MAKSNTPHRKNWQHLKAASLIGMSPALVLTGLPVQAADQLEEILVTATRRAETDVQTTPVAVTPVTEREIARVIPRDLGDILISVPDARRQAEERGQGMEREIRTLILHGILHCLGMDHETDGGEMELAEKRLHERWLANE